ncbi:MAG: TetR/AcrR family transcriptional regulator [Myxococcota bacterium]
MTDHRDHYHHGNLREALVDAAKCLIAESGVAGLSLRQVAKHAGVSQAAPYHHFPNKDAMLAELAGRGFAMLIDALQSATAHEDPVERMRAMGHAYVRFGLEQPAIYRLMFGAEFCPVEAYPSLQEAGSTAFGTLVMAVQYGQASGAFAGSEPMAPSLAVWSSMHGLVSLLQNKIHEKKEMAGQQITTETMSEATIAFVLHGLTAGAAPTLPG